MRSFAYTAAAFTAALAALASAQANKSPFSPIDAALQAGEPDHAISLLQSLPPQLANTAQAHNLACRVQLTLQNWNAALQQCQQSVQLDGQDSNDHLWLARTLGQTASRASFLTAYSMAKRAKTEFETAARLDPRNPDALSDLADYYISAPAVVGGGLDKAVSVAAQLQPLDPARAAVLRGRIAARRGDYGTAEREFKSAIALSPHPGSEWIVLAFFYRSRQRWPEMEAAIRSCDAVAERDHHPGAALYDGASILMETGRDPQLAIKMMKAYLASPRKTEEAPAFEADLRLARLEARVGDNSDAYRDRAAALALAHNYAPAQEFQP